ncbi:hypothetical protein L798_14555 [Zootermopsis nevadensis]|uniref:Uncharacterized protein n=1 Tax=Zootermopsis nevadensis TaxID=136037 RepID=A0A067R1L7_ZOONE|nr:hypothetical protein L798_14555 [Zootermopsis nevadensis]
MRNAKTKENLVAEFETLKQMTVDMGHCLEMLQFVRKDLETLADNLEMLEALNKDWCHSCKEEEKIKNKNNVEKQ